MSVNDVVAMGFDCVGVLRGVVRDLVGEFA